MAAAFGSCFADEGRSRTMVDDLDPLIHQPTRLRIMALLVRNREAPFTWVYESLGLTPGNLDSHIGRLAAAGYVKQWRALTAKGFHSRLAITDPGEAAYQAYLKALRSLIEQP